MLGADGVTEQDPETRPQQLKKSPAPLFHAFRKSARKALYEVCSDQETEACHFRPAASRPPLPFVAS